MKSYQNIINFRERSGPGDIKNCILEIHVSIRTSPVLHGSAMKRLTIHNEQIRGQHTLSQQGITSRTPT